MRRSNSRNLCLAAALSFVAICGCPSGPAGLDTEYVEGVVTIDGTPVPDATVMFVPATEGQGLSATGQTDASGVYRLTAANMGGAVPEPGSGTLEGQYLVGVIKSVTEVYMSEEEAHEKGIPYVGPRPGESPKTTHIVPVKYNDPKQSGLTVTVQKGKNTIPIELSSK